MPVECSICGALLNGTAALNKHVVDFHRINVHENYQNEAYSGWNGNYGNNAYGTPSNQNTMLPQYASGNYGSSGYDSLQVANGAYAEDYNNVTLSPATRNNFNRNHVPMGNNGNGMTQSDNRNNYWSAQQAFQQQNMRSSSTIPSSYVYRQGMSNQSVMPSNDINMNNGHYMNPSLANKHIPGNIVPVPPNKIMNIAMNNMNNSGIKYVSDNLEDDPINSHIYFNVSKETWDCGICRKSFREKNDLFQHLRSGTHEAKRFSCSDCGKAFASVGALAQHVEQSGHSRVTKSIIQDVTVPFGLDIPKTHFASQTPQFSNNSTPFQSRDEYDNMAGYMGSNPNVSYNRYVNNPTTTSCSNVTYLNQATGSSMSRYGNDYNMPTPYQLPSTQSSTNLGMSALNSNNSISLGEYENPNTSRSNNLYTNHTSSSYDNNSWNNNPIPTNQLTGLFGTSNLSNHAGTASAGMLHGTLNGTAVSYTPNNLPDPADSPLRGNMTNTTHGLAIPNTIFYNAQNNIIERNTMAASSNSNVYTTTTVTTPPPTQSPILSSSLQSKSSVNDNSLFNTITSTSTSTHQSFLNTTTTSTTITSSQLKQMSFPQSSPSLPELFAVEELEIGSYSIGNSTSNKSKNAPISTLSNNNNTNMYATENNYIDVPEFTLYTAAICSSSSLKAKSIWLLRNEVNSVTILEGGKDVVQDYAGSLKPEYEG